MKLFINNRFVGRSWLRTSIDYFPSGFSEKDINDFIKSKKINSELLDLSKNLYHFCIDDLTNEESNWKKKNWVNSSNAKEFAIASMIKMAGIKKTDLKNIKFDNKKLENAIKSIKSIPEIEILFIKKFKSL